MKVPGVGEGRSSAADACARGQPVHAPPRPAGDDSQLRGRERAVFHASAAPRAAGASVSGLSRREGQAPQLPVSLRGRGEHGRRHAAPDRGARAAQRRVERPARAQPSERHRPPSASDRQMTLQVRDALATMGIRLTDHIIVADDDFVSMAQSGAFAIRQRIGFLSESDSLSYWLIARTAHFACAAHKIYSLRAEYFLRRTRRRKKTDFSLFAAFRPRTL